MNYRSPVISLLLALAGLAPVPARALTEAPNFMLLDDQGKAHELHRADGRAVVLFFTGAGCPVARKSAEKLVALQEKFGKDVTIWLVASEAQADRAAMRKEADELGLRAFPLLMDGRQALALALNVQRTGEAVAIDTKKWSVLYRGAIDDQLAEGAEKPAPTQPYLQAALTAHLAGEPITTAQTTAKGCLLTFEKTTASAEAPVSYVKQIAPLLREKCANCHREGDIGPFAFSSYAVAKRKARMMEEVLLTQRMPPWHADPHFGQFADAPSLTITETQTLLRWIAQGAPQDAGADPLAVPMPPVEDWPLGKPDYIIKLPKPEQIPATGVLDYRHIVIDSPITEDVWLAATVVKPGNRKVVHHALVFARYDGSLREGGLRGVKIAGWAPGRLPFRLPENTGVFLGKNAVLEIEIHYTTNGTPQTDQTEIGLYVQKKKPEFAYKTAMAVKLNFVIPPNEPEARVASSYTFKRDSVIHALIPHMHVRGSWMNYEALYPDGKKETLLSVPRYDFNWQTYYRFTEPRRMPAGTKIQVTGAFDNSTKNLANPDPNKEVRWGEQSWDEMFIGYIGYSELPSTAAAAATPAPASGAAPTSSP